MSEDNERVDRDGNVYERKWHGGYEPKWDMWSQQQARDRGPRERPPDAYTPDDQPLYRRRDYSSSSDDDSSGGAGGLAIIALVVLIIPLVWKGAKWVYSEIRRPATTIQARDKSPIAAGLLSLFVSGGGGQVYLGQTKKGLALIGATWVAAAVFGPLAFLPIVVGAADAYGTATRLKGGELVDEWEFVLGEEARKAYVALGVLAALVVALLICSLSSR